MVDSLCSFFIFFFGRLFHGSFATVLFVVDDSLDIQL